MWCRRRTGGRAGRGGNDVRFGAALKRERETVGFAMTARSWCKLSQPRIRPFVWDGEIERALLRFKQDVEGYQSCDGGGAFFEAGGILGLR